MARADKSTGSYRAGGRDDNRGGSGLKKLLLLLLGLLLLALLILALISLLGGDDDKKNKSSGSGSAGQLSAGKAKLLPPPPNGLSSQAGKKVTGKRVAVQSVNGNEGFFVGSSASDRVYVEWGGDVGGDEASRFQPKQGQKVNLTGPVQAATPKVLAKLKLSKADAKLVKSQKGFVNADKVTAAK